MNPAPDYFELWEYVGVLRRRWLTITLLTLFGIVLAGGLLVVIPKQYTASTLVQVNALPNDANAVGGRTAGPVNMDNEAQLVQSGTVAALVKKEFRSPLSLQDISKNISVTVPPNSTFLQVNYTASSAKGAQQWANAVARAYLYERRVNTLTLVSQGITALHSQSVKLRANIEKLKSAIKKANSGSSIAVRDQLLLSNAQNALLSVQAHINEATPLYGSLNTPHSVIVGQVVTPAILPDTPSSPRKLLVVPGGFALGLVLGLALAFLRDRRKKRIHSAAELERLSRVPTLLHLTTEPAAWMGSVEPQLSKAGQGFAELARHVSATLGGGSHVLVVAATSSGLSGSTVAANLAVGLARTTDETVLICGDAEQTRLPELFGIERGQGLSEALASQATVEVAAPRVSGMSRLRIVPPGLNPYGAVSSVRHAQAARFLTDLLGTARYLVIEVHSVDDESGTFPLAEFAETAILAVEIEQTKPADLTGCIERLDRLQTPVLGSVLLPEGRSRQARQGSPRERLDQGDGQRLALNPVRAYERQPDQASGMLTKGDGDAGDAADRDRSRSPSGDSFNLLDFSGGSTQRRASDSWKPSPTSRVAATERDGFSGPGDQD